MKGIVLAGGSGTRLYPMTAAINKHLLPIYDKPMVYYPLSILMMAGIRDILIISTPEDLPTFKALLKDGEQFGIHLSYLEQPTPDGLAQAFIIGEDFIGDDAVAMILGDNVFYGAGLIDRLKRAVENAEKGRATIFGYLVKDPERFGVIELGSDGKVLSIEEKPVKPRSNYAATGLYFYDTRVVEFAKRVRPSTRNELEITDLNGQYLKEGDLDAIILSRGFFWMDAGTPQSLSDTSSFIRSVEEHQGLKIACLEEIAFNNGWISREHVEDLVRNNRNNEYGKYLARIFHLDI
ncbi:MAG: glucose-1-phosphate thymidylyltransferase RfbA [Methanomassiliicoccales archaeon]|nr:glucose-1-phosphate thymidylyltransferase RfbA [Methanomassiliicoccales archaeon]